MNLRVDAGCCTSKHNNNNNNNRFTAIFHGLPGWGGTIEETLTHPPSRSSSNLYQLLPSTTIHSILPIQITCCLAIFLHNLSPSPLWSTSWSGAHHLTFHTFLHSISVTCPYHHNLFYCISILYHLFLVFDILALIRLLLSTPYLEFHIFYLNITHPSDHSHLCSLKCHLIFFPDRPGLTSM